MYSLYRALQGTQADDVVEGSKSDQGRLRSTNDARQVFDQMQVDAAWAKDKGNHCSPPSMLDVGHAA